MAVLSLAAMVHLVQPAMAAEVRGVAHGQRLQVYLRLGAHETLKVGQELSGQHGQRRWRLKLLEVAGRRARGALLDGARPRRGEIARAVAQVGARRSSSGVLATSPAARRSRGDWRVGRLRIGRSGAVLTSTGWARLRAKPRALLVAARSGFQQTVPQSIHGDFAFVGIGLFDLKGLKSWTFATLRSRLEVPNLGGTRLNWSHDLTLRYDGVPTLEGGSQGGARARNAVAIRRARLGWRGAWGAVGAGRLVMDTGASGRIVDGASAELRLDDWGSITAWGGTAADPVTLGLQLDTGRFGLGWRAAHERGDLQAQWSLGYAAQVVEGKLDPHRIDASLRVEHQQRGEIAAAATLVAGRPDLSGTSSASVSTPSVALARLWLSAATRRSANGWLWRMRYSYHRPTLDRLAARALPWDAWVDGRSHLLSLSADRSVTRGWWFRPSVNAAWLTGPEPYDGLRLAIALRMGKRGRTWSPHAAFHAESGLAFTTLGRAAGPSRGVGMWAGTAYAISRAWRLDGRTGLRYDQVLPLSNGAMRLRTSASVQWLRGPWVVALQVGNDTLLAADPTPGSYKLDWVDATLLVRRRL